MKKSVYHILAFAGMASLLLAACGAPATALPAPEAAAIDGAALDYSTVKSAEEAGGMEALVAAAQAEGELNVITLPRDWCNYGEMIDTFSEKYGITVNSLNPDGGSADEVEAIKANVENTGPQAPDVIDIGLAYTAQVMDEKLVAPYKVATWDTIQATQKDANGYWFMDYGGVLTFQVNTDLVSTVPQDWSDLLNPEYKGQVAIPGDPRASNQAAQTVFAAGLFTGGSADDATAGLEFFKQVNEQGNLLPLIANSGTFAKGESPIVVASWNYLASAAKDTLAGNPEVEVVYPKSGTLGNYYVQAISAYAPHPAAARLWEEFLYSDEGHLIWMNGYCVPVRFDDMSSRGVIPAEVLAKLPAPEVMGTAVFPTVEQLTNARELIKDQWDSVVGLDISEAQ